MNNNDKGISVIVNVFSFIVVQEEEELAQVEGNKRVELFSAFPAMFG